MRQSTEKFRGIAFLAGAILGLFPTLTVAPTLAASQRETSDSTGRSETPVALEIAAPEQNPVVPLRRIVYREEQIRQIRKTLLEDPRGRQAVARRYLGSAEEWLARGISGVEALLPGDGAVHAIGLAGDPKTGGAWPRWGRSGDVCGLDRPGEVRSPHTGDIYGIQEEGEPYYDPGDGWVDPQTGRRYYFKGVWNAYVVRQLHEAVDDLAVAYMLTGNEEVARLGLHLLDHFAGWRSRHPDDNGLVDWPHRVGPGYGFTAYMGNNANVRMIESVLAFDLLANAPHAGRPSATDPEITVKENILQNYFGVFEAHYIARRNSLQNHATAAFGAYLAKGRLLGDPEKIETGIEATLAFLDSCINRDGDYYEVSGSYGQLGRRYGGQLIALLMNYSPETYSEPARFPRPSDYPFRLDFGSDPRWYAAAVEMLYQLPILGRYPDYGNKGPDRDVLPGGVQPGLSHDRATYLRFFYHMTERDDWKEEIAGRFHALPPAAQAGMRRAHLKRFGATQWLNPPAPKQPAATGGSLPGSTLLPGKGILALRSGEGPHKRALFMRGGIGASHAQDDQMALILYGRGMVTSGRYGYNVFGNPDHLGWGSRSISQKMAVVDEDRIDDQDKPRYIVFKRVPAAEITAYVPRPPVQLAEMRNPEMWRQVTDPMEDYRRTAWLVDVSDTAFYFIDLFHLVGGRTHDYPWHSPYLVPPRADDGFRIEGVEPETVNDVWVLAALENEEFRGATFNRAGQSWGERVLGYSGLLRDLGLGDMEEQSWWNPPPGNGYGMIWNVKRAATGDDWRATWLLHDEAHSQRIHAVNFDGMEVITGRTPVLEVDHRQRTVIARRRATRAGEPLRSRFATVNEIAPEGEWTVEKVEKLPISVTENERSVAALRVHLAGGIRDTILGARENVRAGFDGGAFRGKHGFVRTKDDVPTYMMLHAGTELRYGAWRIRTRADEVRVHAAEVSGDADHVRIRTDRPFEPGGLTRGLLLRADRPPGSARAYGHPAIYQLSGIENDNGSTTLLMENQSLVKGYVTVESVDAGSNRVTATFPSELVSETQMEYFNGRLVSLDNVPDRATVLKEFQNKRTFTVEDASLFATGDRIAIHSIQAEDVISVPMRVTLESTGGERYRLETTCDVALEIPAPRGSEVHVLDRYDRLITRVAAAPGRNSVSLVLEAAQLPHGIAYIQWQ